MRYLLHTSQYATPSAVTSSTADADWPDDNVAQFWRPNWPWKSTVLTGTQYVQLDFGTAINMRWIGVENVNFTSLTAQADNDVAFGSPTSIWSGVTVAQNLVDQRYKHGDDVTVNAERYLRITCASPLAGHTVFQVGSVFVATTDPTTITPSLGVGETPVRAIEQHPGERFGTLRGARTQDCAIDLRLGVRSTERARWLALMNARGTPVIIDDDLSGTHEDWVCGDLANVAEVQRVLSSGYISVGRVVLRGYE